MDFALSPDEEALVAGAERACREHLAPLAAEARASGDLAPLRQAMAAQGLLGLNLPPQYGGVGLPLLTTLLVLRTVQSVDTTLGGLTHRTSTGAVGAILHLGTEWQKEHFVARVARGEIGISIGITEPDAGSAATSLKTTARIDGDNVRINGQKCFITAAKDNHYTVVYCRFGNTGKATDIGAVIVPHDAPGFHRSSGTRNMADELQYELFFDDCVVPRTHVLADGNAFGRLIGVYDTERLGSIARMLGCAKAAYQHAVAYVQERKQFGRELADFQGLQWMLADMRVKLDAAELLCFRAAANIDAGRGTPLEVSIAKVYTAQAAKEICDDAIQLFGGYGYMQDYPVERLYREVRGGSIYGGTVQIHKNMIAGHVLGRRIRQTKPGNT